MLAEYAAKPGEESFANNCLVARRLAERGVRFIQLYHWGWDTTALPPKTAQYRLRRPLPRNRSAHRRASHRP